MLLGSGATLIPYSTVEVGSEGVKITDINPFSATLIGVGAIIFIVGVALYLKER